MKNRYGADYRYKLDWKYKMMLCEATSGTTEKTWDNKMQRHYNFTLYTRYMSKEWLSLIVTEKMWQLPPIFNFFVCFYMLEGFLHYKKNLK